MAIKILVFSDSHGRFAPMRSVILKEKPELVMHLGDGLFDMYKIQAEFPGIPAVGVRGNCDVGASEQTSKTLSFEGVKFFMAHGHIYGVKSGLGTAIEAACAAGADVLLFGHTHHPMYEMSGLLHVLNPGSISEGAYGIIEIKDGKPFCRLKGV